MKLLFFLGLAALITSCAHVAPGKRSIASEKGNETGNRLIKEGRSVYLINKKLEVYFTTNGKNEFVMEDNVLSLKFIHTNEVFPLARFDEVSGQNENDVRVSTQDLNMKVHLNKKDRNFKASVCSHMGCFPYPHFETTYQQLIEIQTLDGRVVCFNYNAIKRADIWTVGTCPSP